MRTVFVESVVVTTLLALAPACPVDTPPDPEPQLADALFDPRAISHFHFDVTDDDLAALDTAPREYVPAALTLTVGDDTHGPIDVGLALKGNEAGSFRPLREKAAFKVKFDEIVRGQRLLGLEGVKLNNMVEDPSQTHEVVGYALLGHLGIPSARAGYSTVTVNDVDYGLHVTIERVDDQWAERHFASTQHIYEAAYAGLDLEPGREHDLEVDEGDPDDRADVISLIEAAAATDDAFLDTLRARTDADLLLRTFAASQYLAHWDGYAGGTNNYYLHSDDDGRFTFVPSGLDQSLGDPAYDLRAGQSPFAPQGLLFRRCVAVPTCATALDDAFARLRGELEDFDALALFDDIVDVIEPAVAADPRRRATVDEVRAAQAEARTFLTERPGVLP